MKKRRRKAHKPRDIFPSPVVMGFLHPTGSKAQVEYDLASLIPMGEIEAGRGKAEHFCAVRMALKAGAALSKHFEDPHTLEAMCLIGGVAIDQAFRMADEFSTLGLPQGVPMKCLTDPARQALEMLCEMERMVSGPAWVKAIQETVRDRNSIHRYDPDAAWIVDPKKPETYEPILGAKDGRSCAFVNGFPRCGYLDVLDEQLHFVMPVEDMHARITEPILIVLATPKKRTQSHHGRA